jgi:hypothetical protein
MRIRIGLAVFERRTLPREYVEKTRLQVRMRGTGDTNEVPVIQALKQCFTVSYGLRLFGSLPFNSSKVVGNEASPA